MTNFEVPADVTNASQEGDNGLRSGAGVLERLRIGIETGDLDSAIYSWDAEAEQRLAQSEQPNKQQQLVSGPLQFAERIVARSGSAPRLRPQTQPPLQQEQSFTLVS